MIAYSTKLFSNVIFSLLKHLILSHKIINKIHFISTRGKQAGKCPQIVERVYASSPPWSSPVYLKDKGQTLKCVYVVVYWSAFLTGNINLSHIHHSALFQFCNYTTEFLLLVATIIDHFDIFPDLPTPHNPSF